MKSKDVTKCEHEFAMEPLPFNAVLFRFVYQIIHAYRAYQNVSRFFAHAKLGIKTLLPIIRFGFVFDNFLIAFSVPCIDIVPAA